MERKNRTLLALAIAVLIAVAVLSSFSIPILFGRTPVVALPDQSVLDHTDSGSGGQQDPGGGSYVRVEITPETVQSVIGTLVRPQSYYRELTIETIWGEGESGTATAEMQVWVDGGFTRVETKLSTGLVQHCIVGGGSTYLWYGSDKKWYRAAADNFSADLAQRMPTYEDVLALDKKDITGTGYETLDGLSCIYVEVADEALGYLERYWIGVESGLLVSAETVKTGTVVYRMTSHTMEVPIPQDADFTLPDGTVLHEVSQT